MHLVTSEVLDLREVAPDHWVTTFDAPEIAAAARPGQFVMVRAGPDWDPLLPRAFSIYHADIEAGCVEILYRVVGRGTRQLATLEPGRFATMWGPLGRPFDLPETERVILVAGGVGVPPVVFLAERLAQAPMRLLGLVGASSRKFLVGVEHLRRAGAEVRLATDDGSLGHHGLVTDLLAAALQEPGQATIYACGPQPMLVKTARTALAAGVSCQLALEAPMACGVGACLGCTVPRAGGSFARVCCEGPVFAAQEIDWEAWERGSI
ncbi:MAG: dihydroorotate dehydrogenase electron transfer subunit [Armatimonadetes bacterium]|nr:dihydroorotate dehydrogenase electron transfer subunit [Armatimonadota bacterium]